MARLATSQPTAEAALDVSAYVRPAGDQLSRMDLMIDGAHCANCIRKIENALTAEPGVVTARVNLGAHRLSVTWRQDEAEPAHLVQAVRGLGYGAVPIDEAAMEDGGAARNRALLRAIAVTGFAAGNVMLLSVSVWSGLAADMGEATRGLMHWISALIALPAIAYGGRTFFAAAWRGLRARAMVMDVPISVAVITTAAMSLAETISGGVHVYFDAAVALLFFLLIGRYLDGRARTAARATAERLVALRAVAADVIDTDGTVRSLPIGAVEPGMTVSIAAGANVPVDGVVLSGASSIDTSLITGESLPRDVVPGAEVHAGTVNCGGPLTVRATAREEGSLLSEITALMETAGQARSRHVRLADQAARIYAPSVHVIALATFLGWVFLGGLAWQPALLIAVAVLIITCPCALGLAVPAVQVVAAGALLKRGILLKSADGLERLALIDHVVFDKTGTLTLGRPELANREDIPDRALGIAASLAAGSRHPLSRALVSSAGPVALAADINEIPGMGLEATVDGSPVRLGSRRWCGIESDASDTESELWLTGHGDAPVRFVFRDAPREDAAGTVAALEGQGLPCSLLSGDRAPVADALADRIGISERAAELTPVDKLDRLRAMTAQGARPLMVGDGLNDAPALAAGFASMSPAEGSAITQTAADFVFQGARLAPVVEAIAIARRARRLVLQNFGIALVYNLIAVPLAVAGVVTPLIAAIAMSGSSIIVTLNALRLKGSR